MANLNIRMETHKNDKKYGGVPVGYANRVKKTDRRK